MYQTLVNFTKKLKFKLIGIKIKVETEKIRLSIHKKSNYKQMVKEDNPTLKLNILHFLSKEITHVPFKILRYKKIQKQITLRFSIISNRLEN